MATEDIIIRYKADVSQLEQDLTKLEKSQQDILTLTQKQGAEAQKAVNTQALAQKKRTELIEVERARLIKLREAQKLAFDPVIIDKFNKEIAESTRRIALLENKTREVADTSQQAFTQIRGSLQNIAGAFGVAFSVEAIVQFAKASVDAFLQAEKSAEQLRNAIVSVGGETENAFNRLIAQSQILQQTTIFGDDDIQNAQQVLSTFGLTSAQIEELLPKLADFATVTGSGIAEAANKLGAGLQGAGREFKKFGIDVSSNNTELENFQRILQGLDKFAGSAEKATQSLSGSFEQLRNDANNAQEEIGSKFASSWLTFQKGAFTAINALLGFNKATQDKADASNIKSINDQLDYAAELEAKYGREVIDTTQVLEERRAKLEQAQAEALFDNVQLSKIEKEREESIYGILFGQTYITGKTEEQRAKNDEILRQTKVQLDYIDGIAQKKAEEEATAKRVLKVDDLRLKSTKDLNALLNQQKDNYDLVGQSNEKLIQEELDKRKEAEQKAREEYKKTAEARKQLEQTLANELRGIQKELETNAINLIEPKSFAEAVDKIEQLRDLNKQYVDEDINLKIAQAKANNTLTKEASALFESIRQGRKDLIDQKSSKDILTLEQTTIEQLGKLREDARRIIASTNIEDLAKQTEEQGKKFEEIIANVEKGIGIAQREEAQKNLAQRFFLVQKSIISEREARIDEVKKQAELNLQSVKDSATSEEQKKVIRNNASKDIKKIREDAQKELDEAGDKYDQATDKLGKGVLDFVQQNAQALQQVGAILGEIANLYDQFAEKRIEQIEAEKDAQLSAIDEQLKKDEETLELKRISEEEAYARKKSLEEQKVKLEEEATKKIREIKRKQAILDKANALFQIAINTAQALASLENLKSAGILTPLILALSGLQAAAVISQPIPYRKGSKDTGSKGHMARVGEEGEEIVYMPSHSKVLPARQTKEYSEILDAMFDNNLNRYIAKTYVAPALQRQKVAYDNDRQSSFAENISKSIYYNGGLNANDLEKVRRKGQAITNVDEIAKAIASKLPTYDPYRR